MWRSKVEIEARVTPPKFNNSPLKNDGWKTTFLLERLPIFRGEMLNFRWVPWIPLVD